MDFVALVKQAIADYKAGNWLKAAIETADAISMALKAIQGHPVMQSTPVPCPLTPCADLAACCAEIESRLPVDGPGVQAIDPATILVLLPYVLDFLKLLWERRQ